MGAHQWYRPSREAASERLIHGPDAPGHGSPRRDLYRADVAADPETWVMTGEQLTSATGIACVSGCGAGAGTAAVTAAFLSSSSRCLGWQQDDREDHAEPEHPR